MPQYYFDLKDGTSIQDEDGLAFADDAEARLEAIRFGGSMLRDFPDHEHWIVIVRSNNGREVAKLKFLVSEQK